MDIHLLALNVGNSRLAIGTFVAGELGPVQRIPHTQRSEWTARIAEAWGRLGGRDAAVVAAGVNPPLIEPLEHSVEQATGRRTLWVGKDLELPIKVLTDEPEQTGVDRLLNVA